jgi:hypothetical protein
VLIDWGAHVPTADERSFVEAALGRIDGLTRERVEITRGADGNYEVTLALELAEQTTKLRLSGPTLAVAIARVSELVRIVIAHRPLPRAEADERGP